MSLYKSSSLVMIPTAYKDGKLYSVRPTDGSGDFTFSRGSNLAATRVDVNGLIEKGRENLLLQSNQFDTTWATTSASITGGQSGYDGTNDAWLLNETAVGGRVFQTISGSGVMTISLYAKSGSLDYLLIYVNTTSSDPYAYFDLATGAVGNTSQNIDANIEAVGGGWYRLSVTGNVGTLSAIEIYPADSTSTHTNTAGSIYIQDAQLEAGLVATDYIETGASTAQAGILEDMPRLDYSGGASCPALLLEPQRTNLFTQSEYLGAWSTAGSPSPTLTNNYAESPEGVDNAYRIQIPSVSGLSLMAQLVSHTSGTDMTISAYVKSNVVSDQSFKLFGDYATGSGTSGTLTATSEWQRFTFTFTPTATGNRNAGILNEANTAADLLVYGMQIEAGSYLTSYIPTYGSSVTRSSDKPISSSYNYQAENILGANVGTIILDCETIGTSTGSNDFHMFGAANNIQNGYLFRANAGTTMDILERNSNASTAQWSSVGNKQTRNKIGVSYSGADVDVYVNGVAKSLSSGTPQGGGNINGFATSQSNSAGLIIHQILIFPNKLTDSEMASITTL